MLRFTCTALFHNIQQIFAETSIWTKFQQLITLKYD